MEKCSFLLCKYASYCNSLRNAANYVLGGVCEGNDYMICRHNYMICRHNYMICRHNYMICRHNYMICRHNYMITVMQLLLLTHSEFLQSCN